MCTMKQSILFLMLLVTVPAWSADPFIQFSKAANAMVLAENGNSFLF